MRTIKRWELVKMVSKRVDHECPQWVIYYVIQEIFHCMEDVLRDGNRIVIRDTFCLEPRWKADRRVSNFGDPITIPGHYEPHFKAYSKLKRACAGLSKEEVERVDADRESEESE